MHPLQEELLREMGLVELEKKSTLPAYSPTTAFLRRDPGDDEIEIISRVVSTFQEKIAAHESLRTRAAYNSIQSTEPGLVSVIALLVRRMRDLKDKNPQNLAGWITGPIQQTAEQMVVASTKALTSLQNGDRLGMLKHTLRILHLAASVLVLVMKKTEPGEISADEDLEKEDPA